jgi:uncharacterized repeat protein (TIGR04138 family)
MDSDVFEYEGPDPALLSAANEMGVPIEALLFISDALLHTPNYCGEEPYDVVNSRPCSAKEFCRAFISFAMDLFGDDYISVLRMWNLDTSEKLGRVVYELIDRRLLEQQEGDLLSDFDGQFDLSESSRPPNE